MCACSCVCRCEDVYVLTCTHVNGVQRAIPSFPTIIYFTPFKTMSLTKSVAHLLIEAGLYLSSEGLQPLLVCSAFYMEAVVKCQSLGLCDKHFPDELISLEGYKLIAWLSALFGEVTNASLQHLEL